MILFACAVMGQAPKGIESDPAFTAMKVLVGGVWKGTVEKGTKVEFRFTLEQNGQMLVSNGLLGAGSKHPYPIRTSIGWDAAAKQVYYLDQHGNDTIYFGHVTKQGDVLLWDFKGLVGDTGHYISREKIGPNDYSSTMSMEKSGQWIDMGFHLSLHRDR